MFNSGFLMVPWFLSQLAGCQVMDIQPSTALGTSKSSDTTKSLDMPRTLPKPATMVETTETQQLVAKATPAPGESSLKSLPEPKENKKESASPFTLPAFPQILNAAIPGAAATSKPVASNTADRDTPRTFEQGSSGQGSSGVERVAMNRGNASREKAPELLQVASAPRAASVAASGLVASAIPSDPILPSPGVISTNDPLMTVYKRGYDWFQDCDSFTCRMVRREVIGGRRRPEELMSFQYRRNPYSIHLKWLGQEGKGREMVYIENKFDNRIQIRLAAGDIPFAAAGKRMTFSLDNPLVRSSSRHSVHEASFGFMLACVGNLINQQKMGTPKTGTIQYAGKIMREDYGGVLEMVEVKLFPGTEEGLPQGGRRLYGFDPVVGMPCLVQTFDENGQEVEYYKYDRFFSKGLDDNDFDPEILWAKPDVAAKP